MRGSVAACVFATLLALGWTDTMPRDHVESSPNHGFTRNSQQRGPVREYATTNELRTPAENGYKIVCYLGAWAIYRPEPMSFRPRDVQAQGCTHLIYSFAGLHNTTLEMVSLDPTFDIKNGGYAEAIALKKKNPDLKVMIAIGGWGEGGKKYSDMANTAASRTKFVKSAVAFLEEHGFDGLDYDWEYPGAEDRDGRWIDKENFALLVEETYAEFRPHGWLLSAAVSPAGFRVDSGYHVRRLSAKLDFINVMTYDLRGPWTKFADHHAPLQRRETDKWDMSKLNTRDGLKLWIEKGADPKKVLLGVPFYGRSFELENSGSTLPGAAIKGAGPEAMYTQEDGYWAYFEVCKTLAAEPGWTIKKDGAGGPYAYKDSTWVGYDDYGYVSKKMDLVKELGLGGGFIWAIDMDDFNGGCGGKWPLLRAINEKLSMAGASAMMPITTAPATTMKPMESTTMKPMESTTMEPMESTTMEPMESTTMVQMESTTMKPMTTMTTEKPSTMMEPSTTAKPPMPSTPLPSSESEFQCQSDGWFRDAFNCKVYYRCVSGVPFKSVCADPLVFDNEMHVCNWPGDVADCPSGSAADNGIVGRKPSFSCPRSGSGLFSSPDDCSMYTWCNEGRTVQLTCGPYMRFDAKIGACNYPHAVQCQPGVATRVALDVASFRATAEDNKVICQFTNWAWRRDGAPYAPENIDPSLCTHVVYQYAVLDPNSLTVESFDERTDFESNFITRMRSRLGSQTKLLLAVGGLTDSVGDKYSRMAATSTSRAKFIQSVVKFVTDNGFDGLDLHWSFPGCPQGVCSEGSAMDKGRYSMLLKELRAAFDVQDSKLLLTAAVSAHPYIISKAYDVAALNKYLDFVNLMTFDFHGGWETVTGLGAPLYGKNPTDGKSVDAAVKKYTQLGLSKSKIIVGLPFYGQSYKLATKVHSVGGPAAGPGLAGEKTQQRGMLAYYEVCFRLRTGWMSKRSLQGAPYMYHKDQWASYEDVRSIGDKTQYIKANALGGAMVWTMDLDDFENDCCLEPQPLLRAVSRGLRGAPAAPSQPSCTKPPPVVTPAPPLMTTTYDSGSIAGNNPTTPSSSTSWTTPSTTTTTRRTTTTTTTMTTTTTQSTTAVTVSPDPDVTTPPPSGLVFNKLGFAPDPSSCSSYYRNTPEGPIKLDCSKPLHFNLVTSQCDWPEAVGCTIGVAGNNPTTPSSSTSRTATSPSTTTTTTNPTTTTTTTMTTTTTQSTTAVTVSPDPDVTTPPPRGLVFNQLGFAPDPSSCRSYYRNTPEGPIKLDCSKPLHFNPVTSQCDWSEAVGCKIDAMKAESLTTNMRTTMKPMTRTMSPMTTPKKTTMPGTMEPMTMKPMTMNPMTMKPMTTLPENVPRVDEPCVDGTFAAIEGDCKAYIWCLTGMRLTQQCASGLLWNQDRQICDWPENFDSPCSSSTETTDSSTSMTEGQMTESPMTESQMTESQMTESQMTESQMTESSMTESQMTTMTESANIGRDNAEYKMVCYFTNWAMYRPGIGKYKPEDINPDLCTHIVYGFATLDYSTHKMRIFDRWADIDSPNMMYEKVTALKKKGKKVLIALGGWNDSLGNKYSELVKNAAYRKIFIDDAVQFLKEHNFDGLDLDWEYPVCWQVDCTKGPASDKEMFATWVRELDEAFEEDGFLLSAAVSPSKKVIDAGYDVPEINKHLDWIAVMTYDFHGHWDKKTGHVSPYKAHPSDDYDYFNTKSAIEHWIAKGASPRKIVLGMPLYGQSFTLEDPSNTGLNSPSSGPGEAGTQTRARGFLAYYEICQRQQQQGWTTVQDPMGSMGPYAYKGNQWVSFDDKDSLRKKTAWIKEMGLGGGMIWALDLDDFNGVCSQGKYPLLTVIAKGLNIMATGGDTGMSPGTMVTSEVEMMGSSSTTMASTTTAGSTTMATPQAPATGGSCSNQGEYRPHTDCGKYLLCNNNEYLIMPCASGLHWNAEKKICDYPESAKCDGNKQLEGKVDPVTTEEMTEKMTTKMAEMTMSPATTEAAMMPDMGNEKSQNEYKMVCYFTNWAMYRPGIGKYTPEDINPDLCTHIVYGFATLDSSTHKMRIFDRWADIDSPNMMYEKVTALKKKGKKVLIALGGWNDSLGSKYSELVKNAAYRKIFIDDAVQFLKEHNFDGLDLDWEYPVCWQVDCTKGPASDKEMFATWVRELDEAFEEDGFLLSAAVSPSKKVIDAGYDVPEINKHLDWIAVMTYDFHGHWDKKTGHVSPYKAHPSDDYDYFNTQAAIEHWIAKGASPRKIVLGMPLYGQSFTLEDPSNTGLNSPSSGPGEAGTQTRARGFLAYYEICQRQQQQGWTTVQDPMGRMGPYAYKGNQWVSFDDKDSLRKKAAWIKEMGLGGGMIWALDLDDFDGVCSQGKYPLLTVIAKGLNIMAGGGDTGMSSVTMTEAPVATTFAWTTPDTTTAATTTSMATTTLASGGSCNTQGAYVAHADCNKYKLCNDNKYMVFNCPSSLHWDAKHQTCSFPDSANCVGNKMESPTAAPTSGTTLEGKVDPMQEMMTTRDDTMTEKPMTSTDMAVTAEVDKEEPDMMKPDMMKPDMMKPDMMKPDMMKPDMMKPDMMKPDMMKPDMMKPDMMKPDMMKPDMMKPDMMKPDMIKPDTMKPDTGMEKEQSELPVEFGPFPPAEQDQYKVVCYFTNWAWYRPGAGKYKPENIDSSLCTHVMYGFAVLGSNGLMRPHDGWADLDNDFYAQVTALKQKGIKVVLALGGWNDSAGDKYSKLVNDPARRRSFIEHAVEFVEKYNFDGLDLDWEYPKCWQVDCTKGPESDKEAFSAWIRELNTAFKARSPPLLLTAAVSPNKKVIDAGYEVGMLSKYLDIISVMTYDYHGHWDKKTGHLAPMYYHPSDEVAFFNTDFTIKYWIDQGADRKKIVMGMPMYGQAFGLADTSVNGLNAPAYGKGEAGQFTRAGGFLAYYEICYMLKSGGWTVVKDPKKRMGPYAYKGTQWVSFDDTDMIRYKSEYIRHMGLGGGMIWALDLDDFRNRCGCEVHPLLRTINRVLRQEPEASSECQVGGTVVQATEPPPPGSPGATTTTTTTPKPPPQSPTTGGSCTRQGEYRPHVDCAKFLVCNNNNYLVQSCAAGLHWNANSENCDYPGNAKCEENMKAMMTSTTAPSPDTTLEVKSEPSSRDPASTPSYPIAPPSTTKAPAQTPSSPIVPPSTTKAPAQTPSSPIVPPSTTKAPAQPDGTRELEVGAKCEKIGEKSPSEVECDLFFTCVNGELQDSYCPPGTHYNRATTQCDWPASAKCPYAEKPPATSSPSQTGETGGSQSQLTTTTAAPTAATEAGTAADTSYKVVCYFTNWSWYRRGKGKYSPSKIDTELCTHIVYGFTVLHPTEYTIKTHDPWADVDNEFYTKVSGKKGPRTKVLVAIGGWNDSLGSKYSVMVNSAALRKKFIQSVIVFIKKFGFDGLDLDWEYPACWQVNCDEAHASDKQGFTALMKELRQEFDPLGWLLTAAVSPNKKVIDLGYEVPMLSKYLDIINVMTYDFHGHWDKKTGAAAPMYYHPDDDVPHFNANFTMNYYIEKGADRKKLVMGIPMYGQSFGLTESSKHGLNAKSYGKGKAGKFTRAAGFLSFYEICEKVQTGGYTVVKDPENRIGPYAYKGQDWFSYDDRAMVKQKSQFIKDMGLAGGMIWALDLDDFRGTTCGCEPHPLLRTINRVLRDYSTPEPTCNI